MPNIFELELVDSEKGNIRETYIMLDYIGIYLLVTSVEVTKCLR
jgi:hypothetical protein